MMNEKNNVNVVEQKLRGLCEVRMPEASRQRILRRVAEESRMKKHAMPRIFRIGLLAAAIAAVAMVAAGAAAVLQDRYVSHFPTTADSDIVMPQTDAYDTAVSDGGEAVSLWCNAVTGGGDKVYFDLTLEMPMEPAPDGMTLCSLQFPDATVTFADGLVKKLYLYVLPDSAEGQLHLEGSVLFMTSELGHIGEGAVLKIGRTDAIYVGESGAYEVREIADKGLSVNVVVDFRNETRDVSIKPIVLSRDGVTITLTSLTLTNTDLMLRGSCDSTKELLWLKDLMDNAVITLSDGTVVRCGRKNGCGTKDAEFVMDWLLETALDASKAVSFTIGSETVAID